MIRRLILAMVAAVCLSTPAMAAKMTAKEKCLRNILDVRETQEAEETPKVGEKAQAQVDHLLEIARHLCEQGNFQYAESLLEIARGMVVSE